MNLPASALNFLPSFVGIYAEHETLFCPHTETQLPLVHVYCFSSKSDDNAAEKVKICKEISDYLELKINEAEVDITDVRDVSPSKRMFCASFRLPAEVAFRKRGVS